MSGNFKAVGDESSVCSEAGGQAWAVPVPLYMKLSYVWKSKKYFMITRKINTPFNDTNCFNWSICFHKLCLKEVLFSEYWLWQQRGK